MESKKPNRQKEEHSRLAVPIRGKIISRRPNKHQETPLEDTEQSEVTTKQTAPDIRRFVCSKKGAATIGVVVIVVAWLLYVSQDNRSTTKNNTDTGYQTVLPKGKTADQLGGWKRISPPKAEPVYAYSDTLDNVSINVSQQPLPKSFDENIDSQVAELAKKFNATDEVDANGTKIYIGTSAKGPQSTIFTKNGLLVLIKSQKKIDDKAWSFYVESLVGTDPTLSNF